MVFEAKKNGVYSEDGGLYYYVDGVRTHAGLIKIGGDYYYARYGGKLATGDYTITTTNGLLPKGTYHFGDDGKMVMNQ